MMELTDKNVETAKINMLNIVKLLKENIMNTIIRVMEDIKNQMELLELKYKVY